MNADPPSGRTRAFAVIAAGFCAMLNLYAPQPILPLLSANFGVSPARAALTVTATALAVGLIAPFAGALSDAKGRKTLIVAALIGVAVPTFACGFATTLDAVLLCRFLQGLFMPAVFAATLAYVNEEWPIAARGRMSANYITATVTGGFLGRFIGGLAADLGDWHMAFLALGVLNLAGAAVVQATMPASRHFKSGQGLVLSLVASPWHLTNLRLLSCYVVGFNVLFALVAVFTYITFYLAAPPFSLRPMALSSLFGTYLLGIFITPFAGRLIDRFGQRRALVTATGVAVVGTSMTLVPVLTAIIVGLTLCCSAVFVCQAAATSYIGQATSENRSSAAGLYIAFYYAGGAAGAFLPGLAYARGGWTACVLLAVTVQAVVGWFAAIAWRTTASPVSVL